MELAVETALVRAEEHERPPCTILEMLDQYALDADSRFARDMYVDARAHYEQAAPGSEDAQAMHTALVEHGLTIDDPDLVAAALPHVRPHNRHMLVAQAANMLHRQPEHFTRLTRAHVDRWWDDAMAVGPYAVQERFGTIEAVKSQLSMVTARFLLDFINPDRQMDDAALYAGAAQRFDHILSRAEDGGLVHTDPYDDSEDPGNYSDDRAIFGHVAGTAGNPEAAIKYCGFETAALYRAVTGQLEDEHVDAILADDDYHHTMAYQRLVAQTAMATRGVGHRGPDTRTRVIDNTMQGWLLQNIGTPNIDNRDLLMLLRNAGHALSRTNLPAYEQAIRGLKLDPDRVTGPDLLDTLLDFRPEEVPPLLSSYYHNSLRHGMPQDRFRAALYAATHPAQLEPQDDPTFRSHAERAANLAADLAAHRFAYTPDGDRQQLGIALYGELAKAPPHHTAEAALASLTVMEAMDRDLVLTSGNARAIIRSVRNALELLRLRKSQEATVDGILVRADELASGHEGGRVEYLKDLHLTEPKKFGSIKPLSIYL